MKAKTEKVGKKPRDANRSVKNECIYKNLDLPAEIALYYGFNISENPSITKDDLKKSKILCESEYGQKELDDVSSKFSLEEKIAIFRIYQEKKWENAPQPIMLYFGKPFISENANKKESGERKVSLEIIGTQNSISEAILIQTSLGILKEEGYKDLSVHINSVGDRDTLNRFAREISNYYRKNISELPTHCRQLLKKDLFGMLACKNEKCRMLRAEAPKSMNFLSESSRAHFKEVLEYLEILEIPYEIDPFLLGNKVFSCQTIFEIHNSASAEKGESLASGVRYANIAKKLGLKRDLPGVGVHITFKETDSRKNLKFMKPKIYFIQLGSEAKLKSLQTIEILRKEKIPMYQAISRDKMVSQLGMAESMKIPYTVIMGQKEALEDSVIVRNMKNHAQETVKICDLPKYLKKL